MLSGPVSSNFKPQYNSKQIIGPSFKKERVLDLSETPLKPLLYALGLPWKGRMQQNRLSEPISSNFKPSYNLK